MCKKNQTMKLTTGKRKRNLTLKTTNARLTKRMIQMIAVPLLLLGLSPITLTATANRRDPGSSAADGGKPFIVEYYYKAKWGYADEFIRLFKKDHYPVLKKEQELGRILRVSAQSPKYHTTKDGRWDYRVTIVWKNVEVAHDDFDSQSLIRQLFPDQDTYKKEEQRRFEVLSGHWDVPVVDVDLDK
jgi:hypothetical protein